MLLLCSSRVCGALRVYPTELITREMTRVKVCLQPIDLYYGDIFSMNESGGCERKWGAQLAALGHDISAMETDFHTKSSLSLAGLGSLWYENRANPSSSGCCHVFILQTRCPFINLWLILALRLKRLVLNGLILDCCFCSSKRTCFVSHRSVKVLNSTTVPLCNAHLPTGPGMLPIAPYAAGQHAVKLK